MKIILDNNYMHLPFDEEFKLLTFLNNLMSKPENKKPHSLTVQMFEKNFNKYDVKSLLFLINGSELSVEEIELNYQPYGDFVQRCYEKEPIKTSKYLVEKAATLLNHAYSGYKAIVADKGMKENNPETVDGLIENWKDLKKRVALRDRIMFDENEPPSCLHPAERLNYLQELESHLHKLKK